MGACCSCVKSKEESNEETELVTQTPQPVSFHVSTNMSHPSIQTNGEDGFTIMGQGLALIDVDIEQDSAYWEWHVERVANDGEDGTEEEDFEEDFFGEEGALSFGVATRKSPEFYKIVEENEDNDDTTALDDGTALMKALPVLQVGDVVGVAVQQSDLPMIQFLLNGEPLHDLAINRFRGSVYPSVGLKDGYEVRFVPNEENFRELSPHVRFGPIMVSRGLI